MIWRLMTTADGRRWKKLCRNSMASATPRSRPCPKLGRGFSRRIPMEHQAALIDAGFGQHAREGFMLTDLGKAAADVARDRRWG
jgi:hypothetical protein